MPLPEGTLVSPWEREVRNAGSFLRKELGGALRNTEYAARNFMSHIRSLRDLGFSAKSLLSSVACGDTFFQRKKAIALRHAALETPGAFPQRLVSP